MEETKEEKILNKLQYIVLELNCHKGRKLDETICENMLKVINECKELINKVKS
jgi:hypothetical protein